MVAASMTFLVKFCRLLYETGFYTRPVFLCMSTLNQTYVPTVYLEHQASIENRLLYETGFNTRHYGILKMDNQSVDLVSVWAR